MERRITLIQDGEIAGRGWFMDGMIDATDCHLGDDPTDAELSERIFEAVEQAIAMGANGIEIEGGSFVEWVIA